MPFLLYDSRCQKCKKPITYVEDAKHPKRWLPVWPACDLCNGEFGPEYADIIHIEHIKEEAEKK